jgi:hypothetical protein
MTDALETLVFKVRGDREGFARDLAAMRADLAGELGGGAENASRTIETALARATRNGRASFEDLGRAAVRALADIAGQALKTGLGGGGAGSGAGGGLLNGLAGSLLGLPGRATGGLVSPGRGYRVGEQGPEVFVPTGSGAILPAHAATAGTGSVNVTVNVAAPAGADGAFMARTGGQVARAVRDALNRAGR